ncbi:bifunctional DNA primase/polymerase, partial [Mycolicibacterium austroafricanum]|uniref:bifunctional DNA primase/polymerase n=1 Tax=Mycolicibacterium austroafricanum TaxID=39687 RepID=UPI001057015C
MTEQQMEARPDDGAGTPLETMLALGFSVGPLDGKIPLTKHGVQDFTRDRQVITRWARQYPGCNWGVTQVGVICLDVDPRHGGTVAALRLRPEHETLTIRTGAEGWHFYYRHTGPVRGKMAGAEGIDVKAGGRGYLVAPNSLHPITGKPYRIHRGGPIANLPEHLQALIAPPTPV